MAKRFMLWWTAAVCLFVALGITIHLCKVQYVFNFNILDFLTAVGTISAVVVALFKESIIDAISPVNFYIKLCDDNFCEGLVVNDDGKMKRYWFRKIIVGNHNKNNIAKNCYVSVVRIIDNDSGRVIFYGDLPLTWTFDRRVVGDDIKCRMIGNEQYVNLLMVKEFAYSSNIEIDSQVNTNVNNISDYKNVSIYAMVKSTSGYLSSKEARFDVTWGGCDPLYYDGDGRWNSKCNLEVQQLP